MKTKTRSAQRRISQERSSGIGRRTFVKLIPALGAAGLVAPLAGSLGVAAQRQPQAQPPLRITKEMLHAAEQLTGIEMTDEQETMALRSVDRNLSGYESLRKIEVPLDTEPAIAFHPAPAGKKFKARPPRTKAARITAPSFSSLEDLAFASAVELGELIRSRRISPVELTKMYITRLKKYGPKLNCVITLTEELALEQASRAEAEIKQGKHRGPLHGVPWGAKDLFATKGIPTTWGAEPYRNQVIDYDAAVVERLRDAGAVLVAKLSMGALAQGDLWFGGRTRNPWDTETGSSGSSAGPAAATAAGLVGFSIGTETLGSIVSPSSTCGVTGLRPTYGRVSRYGAMGLSWTMDKIGPICRTVEDCAAALQAIYGPDDRDITVGDVRFNGLPDVPLSGLRIGYLKNEFDNPRFRQNPEEMKSMYSTALDALRSAGAKLEPIELPAFDLRGMLIILNAEAGAAFDDLTRNGGVNQLSGQTQGDWPNSFRVSRFIPAVEYLRAERARTLLKLEMDKLMSNWDVFVSPAPGSASLTVTNLTGHPAVVVPCGFTSNLPRAIMFTGGLYDEGAPLRVAQAFQQATKWHTMHPKVDWA